MACDFWRVTFRTRDGKDAYCGVSASSAAEAREAFNWAEGRCAATHAEPWPADEERWT